jgi:hypothetical protein
MPICRKCKNEKPLADYCPSAVRKGDYICHACERIRYFERKSANIEHYRSQKKLQMRRLRESPDRQEKELQYSKKYRQTHKEQLAQYCSTYRKNNKQRQSAYLKIYRQLRTGNIQKQPCFVCGSLNSHAHHEDYSKPLDVIWLCPKHHKRLHVACKAAI